VLSFQPTTTTLRFPDVCAAVYVTVTVVGELCGTAALLWTYVIVPAAKAREGTNTRTRRTSDRSRTSLPP
jgi:hypothetical protein